MLIKIIPIEYFIFVTQISQICNADNAYIQYKKTPVLEKYKGFWSTGFKIVESVNV
jgi:hypothetical protein